METYVIVLVAPMVLLSPDSQGPPNDRCIFYCGIINKTVRIYQCPRAPIHSETQLQRGRGHAVTCSHTPNNLMPSRVPSSCKCTPDPLISWEGTSLPVPLPLWRLKRPQGS